MIWTFLQVITVLEVRGLWYTKLKFSAFFFFFIPLHRLVLSNLRYSNGARHNSIIITNPVIQDRLFPFCCCEVVTKFCGLSLVAECMPLSYPLVSYSGCKVMICIYVSQHICSDCCVWCLIRFLVESCKYCSVILQNQKITQPLLSCNHCVVKLLQNLKHQ